MSAVKSEIMENATNVENVGSWPFGQEFLCVDKIPQTGIFLVLHGFLGDWLRVAGNDKYFIIVKKCSSLRYP